MASLLSLAATAPAVVAAAAAALRVLLAARPARTGRRDHLPALLAGRSPPRAARSSSTIELALNDAERSRGLMFREQARPLRGHAVRLLPGDAGQLLDEEHADPARHGVHRRRRHGPPRPCQCRAAVDRAIPQPVPVRAVLEINGGSARLARHQAGRQGQSIRSSATPERIVHFDPGSASQASAQ